MSADEPKPTEQPSSQQVPRRSFLKMVIAGLAASIPIAAGLLTPNKIYAYVPCSGPKRCADRYWLSCQPPCLYACEEHACWDSQTGDLCSYSQGCTRIGGCS